MSDRYTIEMNFRRSTAQADRLDRIAGDLRRLTNDNFESTLNDLQLKWKGDNALKYRGKAGELQESMCYTADGLNEAAAVIREIAERLYNTEMANLAIAEGSDY